MDTERFKGKKVTHFNAKSLEFSVFSPEEVKKLSVLRITTPLCFNVLGHPLKQGLYDPALGPVSDKNDVCRTCSSSLLNCPGHLSYIELPIPVVNPLFYKTIYNILRMSCLKCHTLQMKGVNKLLYITKLNLLTKGLVTEAQEVDNIVADVTLENGEEVEAHQDIIFATVKGKLEYYYNKMISEKKEVHQTALRTKFVQAIINDLLNDINKFVLERKICLNCNLQLKRVQILKNKMTIGIRKTEMGIEPERTGITVDLSQDKLITVDVLPTDSRNYLREIWKNDKDFLTALVPVLKKCDMEHPTDSFFLSVIPVLPPKMRPMNHVAGTVVEHPQTKAYKLIIQNSQVILNLIKAVQDGDTNQLPEEGQALIKRLRGKTLPDKLNLAMLELQADVDHLMDNKLSSNTSQIVSPGVKQIIEKKEGVIRMHMMGKRVNYAARSVITPDPYINIDEIGIPDTFAIYLTYPTPVTMLNVAELRTMVRNGPNIYPGALMVENEDGTTIRLSPYDSSQRHVISKHLLTSNNQKKDHKGIKIVHRHLCNGDILLLNRQPTLHRPSIMAHTARILTNEKTLRLHYANCKAYNADFDGDEMNVHFPQNEIARSEAYNLLSVKRQYLVPKDGTPLSGLIQDHIVAGVCLTVRGKFFLREEYQQLVYQALDFKCSHIKLLPPAIMKPCHLWSGKQVISTIIINLIPKGQSPLNLSSKAKISEKAWIVETPRQWKGGGVPFDNPDTMSEVEVIIREGELLCGVMDKTHYGATPYGLVHCMYELYGGDCSSKMLSSFAKLFNLFLQKSGFTLGVEDILLLKDAEELRDNFIAECRGVGKSAVLAALNLSPETTEVEMKEKLEDLYQNRDLGRALVDSSYKDLLDKYTNDINRVCVPRGLIKSFPHNNLQLMILSGAKGSSVNAMQISCLLGQIELEGRRPPRMISGKQLPCFSSSDNTPRAGGFVDGRFMTGIKPQEFYYHCMAGREGLIDTAVKTSRSGYLQRCLVKHLEGLVVTYDMTVRDSDGSVVQFYYGEDGKDVLKAQFFKKNQISFLAENCKNINDIPQDLLSNDSSKEIKDRKKKIQKWKRKYGSPFNLRRVSPFSLFSSEMRQYKAKRAKKFNKKTGRSKQSKDICNLWQKSEPDTINEYISSSVKCPDPLMADYQSDHYFGVLTEQMEQLIHEYLRKRPSVSKSELTHAITVKSFLSQTHAGDPVGLLAAQSIGEPSTQMTLNTFHFAGRGEMNVTLGIPRLRELLMTASKNIKTPNMDVPFLEGISKSKAEQLIVKLCRTTIADVLHTVEVTDQVVLHPNRKQIYQIRLQFLPHDVYKSKFSVNPSNILKFVETSFLMAVVVALKKVLNIRISGIEKGKMTKDDEDWANREIDGELANLTDERADDVDLVEQAKRSGVGEEHESSDEDGQDDDDDATALRSKRKHMENQEYDEPEEEELVDDDDEILDSSELKPSKRHKESQKHNESEDEDIYNDDESKEDEDRDKNKSDGVVGDDVGYESAEDGQNEINALLENVFSNKDSKNEKVLSYNERKQRVLSSVTFASSYDYDTQEELWCEVSLALPVRYPRVDLTSLLQDVASRSVIWEVPFIKRAISYANQDTNKLTLKTEGINFKAMFKLYKLLDLSKLYSNDVHKISEAFGIEAARRIIVKEVQEVFKVYGIIIDPRHLLLVADYMTYNGKYEPFSRKGFEDNVSPLQQMSFESSVNFLKGAVLRGDRDELASPSSRLMLGLPCIGGTGTFTLQQKLEDHKRRVFK